MAKMTLNCTGSIRRWYSEGSEHGKSRIYSSNNRMAETFELHADTTLIGVLCGRSTLRNDKPLLISANLSNGVVSDASWKQWYAEKPGEWNNISLNYDDLSDATVVEINDTGVVWIGEVKPQHKSVHFRMRLGMI